MSSPQLPGTSRKGVQLAYMRTFLEPEQTPRVGVCSSVVTKCDISKGPHWFRNVQLIQNIFYFQTSGQSYSFLHVALLILLVLLVIARLQSPNGVS